MTVTFADRFQCFHSVIGVQIEQERLELRDLAV